MDTASGIHNALCRTAGLLAIAECGVMMLTDRSALPNTDSATLEKIKVAITESFVFGIRKIMFVSAALAGPSGASSLFFIRNHV